MRSILGCLAALVSLAAAEANTTVPAGATHPVSATLDHNAEVPMIRSYFFTGGQYIPQGNSSDNHVLVNQMYVERLRPAQGVSQALPIVFFHGRGQQGTLFSRCKNFLNTPDGRRGWASEFVAAGYEVYIADEPFRGRSAWETGHGSPTMKSYSAELLQQRFTATERYNLWPEAGLHTQWPGAGVMGDAVFDQFYAACIQFLPNLPFEQAATQAAGAALLDRIGKPAVLVGHSQGGPLPLLIADQRPALAAALILLEPAGPPFHEAVFSNATARDWGVTETSLTYEPPVTNPATDLVKAVRTYDDPTKLACTLQADSPPPRQFKNIAGKRMLVVTSESSYHQVYDHCTVDYLRQAGCQQLEHVYLENVGIKGNGHMMFMEKNSHQIQTLLQRWIEQLH